MAFHLFPFAPPQLERFHTAPLSVPSRMKLSELLQPDMVILPLEADDKWQAIDRLAEVGLKTGAYTEQQFGPVREALEAREKSMTTGMEMGIAIPHAAVDEIGEVIASLGISKTGIPFEALDEMAEALSRLEDRGQGLPARPATMSCLTSS